MSYDNNMSGVLFPNKDKEGQQPDYRGECEINGKKYEIAGWKKQSKNGNPFLSMKFQEPREKRDPRDPSNYSPKKAPKGRQPGEDDDTIPF